MPACQGFGTVIPHPCPECAGDGRVRTRRTLTVKMPPGVDTGTRIQLAGEGEVGPGGGPAGDLFVEIVERPHPIFHRQGDDLHCTVTMPMTAAALGTTVTLETLDGAEAVDIRPGTQSGHAVTLAGRGVAAPAPAGPRRPDRARRRADADPARRRAGGAAAQAGRAARRGRARRGQFAGAQPGLLLPAARRLQRALSRRSGCVGERAGLRRAPAEPAASPGRVVRRRRRGPARGDGHPAGAGEAVVLVDGTGARAPGVVAAAGARPGRGRRRRRSSTSRAPQPRLVVVQALPKGDRGELAVETMTEVGVDVVVPWAAARCVTRWRDGRAADKALARWRTSATAAAKQSRRAGSPR